MYEGTSLKVLARERGETPGEGRNFREVSETLRVRRHAKSDVTVKLLSQALCLENCCRGYPSGLKLRRRKRVGRHIS